MTTRQCDAIIVRPTNTKPLKLMSLIFYFAFVQVSLSQSLNYGGTVLVARYTPNEITIGADSKLTIGDSIRINGAKLCKIYVYQGMVFAHSGVFGDDLFNPTLFNFVKIVDSAYYSDSTISGIVNNYISIMSDAYHKLINLQKKPKPQPLGTFIAGKERDSLFLHAIMFVPDTSDISKPLAIKRTTCPGCNFDSTYISAGYDFILGAKPKIDLQKLTKKWGVVETIRKIILTDIMFYPDYLDEPIDMVYFRKDSVGWYSKQEICPYCMNCEEETK